MQYFSPYILSFVVIFLNQFTFSEFHESSTHHDVKPTSSALNKIERSVDTKLQQKKSELADIQKVYENLLAPVTEPEPCGIRVLRCSNCHRIGHKAEGNSGKKSCPNDICTNYFKCGQERFHNDFRQEKRKVEDNMKTLKREIKDLEAEKAMLESYQMNTNSFASVMRDRLKKSNPSKYSKSSFLLKDIIILKKHYKNEIPPPSINDAEEFARIIERYTNQENEWKNNHCEPTSAADYQFATNETQPKKPKLQNPYQYPQFFPLPFSPAFYPFPYQLSNLHPPFPIPSPVQAPIQLPPTPVQSVDPNLYRPNSVPTCTISSNEDNCNPFENNQLHLLASAASVQGIAESDGDNSDIEQRDPAENDDSEEQKDKNA